MGEFQIRGRGDKLRFRRLRADTRGEGRATLARLVLILAAVAFLMFWLARLGR